MQQPGGSATHFVTPGANTRIQASPNSASPIHAPLQQCPNTTPGAAADQPTTIPNSASPVPTFDEITLQYSGGKITATVPPPARSTQLNDAPNNADNEDNEDSENSGEDSGDDSDSDTEDEFCTAYTHSCSRCDGLFSTEKALERHREKKNKCKPRLSSHSAGIQGLRVLKEALDNGDVAVHSSPVIDISQMFGGNVDGAPNDAELLAAEFTHGWANKAKHGEGKGHHYMNDAQRAKLETLFQSGVQDKTQKKSAAQMKLVLEQDALTGGGSASHPKEIHEVPGEDEISTVISRLVSNGNAGGGAGGRGRARAELPEK